MCSRHSYHEEALGRAGLTLSKGRSGGEASGDILQSGSWRKDISAQVTVSTHLEGRARVRPVDSLGPWRGEAGDGEVTEGQGETAGPGSQEGPRGGGEGL